MQLQLLEACKKGDLNTLEKLYKKGVAFLIVDDSRRTPLYLAAQYGHFKLVHEMLDYGVPLVGGGKSLLHSVYSDHEIKSDLRIKIVELFLRRGGDVDGGGDSQKETLLMTAIRYKDERMIRFLLSHGADINFRVHVNENLERIPLSLASQLEDKTIALRLMQSGAKCGSDLRILSTSKDSITSYERGPKFRPVEVEASENLPKDLEKRGFAIVGRDTIITQKEVAELYRQAKCMNSPCPIRVAEGQTHYYRYDPDASYFNRLSSHWAPIKDGALSKEFKNFVLEALKNMNAQRNDLVEVNIKHLSKPPSPESNLHSSFEIVPHRDSQVIGGLRELLVFYLGSEGMELHNMNVGICNSEYDNTLKQQAVRDGEEEKNSKILESNEIIVKASVQCEAGRGVLIREQHRPFLYHFSTAGRYLEASGYHRALVVIRLISSEEISSSMLYSDREHVLDILGYTTPEILEAANKETLQSSECTSNDENEVEELVPSVEHAEVHVDEVAEENLQNNEENLLEETVLNNISSQEPSSPSTERYRPMEEQIKDALESHEEEETRLGEQYSGFFLPHENGVREELREARRSSVYDLTYLRNRVSLSLFAIFFPTNIPELNMWVTGM